MTRKVVCQDCKHEGDLMEFTYYLNDDSSKFKFTLQCPICFSANCKIVEVKEK